MNEIVKSQWVTDGNRISLSMPLAKVDQENRLVSGYATLDNVDTQGDVVLAEASVAAFKAARGNLREMHQPIAAGHIVDFREDEYITPDGEFYRGIFVTAYVSKGAETTWEKVLDGTLTGFSIGGNITDASNEFVKEQGKSVRFIKSYDLVELSLVDNPANQLANVFSITKTANGQTLVKGMVADVEIENVFYCANDEIFKSVAAEEANCTACGNVMQNIGWVEVGADRTEKVRDVVTKFLGSDAANNDGEGGVKNMAIRKAKDNEDEGVVTSADVTQEEDAKTPLEELKEEAANDNVKNEVDEEKDKAEAVEEVDHSDTNIKPDEVDLGALAEEHAQGIDETPDADEEISKKIDALHTAVKASLEKSRTETAEQVAALEKKVQENADTFLSKVSELEEKFSGFGEELNTAKAKYAELEKAWNSANAEGSFKKSGDVESAEPVQKTEKTWNGAFSIDNMLR